jgi:hypothetical protein
VITLLGENYYGTAPSVEELQEWANAFGITHPVVSDGGWGVTVRFTGYSFALPAMHQMAPGMEILRINTWVTENQVQSALP